MFCSRFMLGCLLLLEAKLLFISYFTFFSGEQHFIFKSANNDNDDESTTAGIHKFYWHQQEIKLEEVFWEKGLFLKKCMLKWEKRTPQVIFRKFWKWLIMQVYTTTAKVENTVITNHHSTFFFGHSYLPVKIHGCCVPIERICGIGISEELREEALKNIWEII